MEYIISKLLSFYSWLLGFFSNEKDVSTKSMVKSDLITISGSVEFNTRIKEHKFYGGDKSNFVDVSFRHLIEAKTFEEILLERKKKSFFERIGDIIGLRLGESENIGDISEYSEAEFLKMLKDFNLDMAFRARLSRDFIAIKNSKRIIRSYENRIRCILGNILKKLRNFKEIYKRQHSFHFKNLDDYHSLILTNRNLVKV